MKSAAILLCLATPAFAECEDILTARAGGDVLEIRESSEGHFAELRYLNEGLAGNGTTNVGDYMLRWQCVDIHIRIGWGEGNDERITVMPDGGYVAFPVEADVPDGSDIVIQIQRPMF